MGKSLFIIVLLLAALAIIDIYKCRFMNTIKKMNRKFFHIMFLLLSLSLIDMLDPAFSQEENVANGKLFFLDQAEMYADPYSELYDPEKAERYYFRSWANEFENLYIPENCIRVFSNVPEAIVKNSIHHGVLSKLQKFCQTPNQELFTVAEDFEKQGGMFSKDEDMALSIYKHLEFRLLMVDNQKKLEKSVEEKIQFLREKR